MPIYGRDARVETKNLKLPWQEVNFKVHWKREIDTREFRSFLKEAIAAFLAQSEKAKLDPNELTPWKVLGRRWHLSKKGFSSPPAWSPNLLERLEALINEAAPDVTWNWDNQQFVSASLNGNGEVFAELFTKRPGGADLVLPIEPGLVPLGRIATLGSEREVTPTRRGEAVRIRFTEANEIDEAAMHKLLADLARTALK